MTQQLTRPPLQPQPHNTADLDRAALWRAYQLILSWPKRGEVQPASGTASGAAVDRAEAKPQPRQEGEQ